MDGKRKAERQPRPEEDIKTTRDLPDEPDLSQGWVLIIIQNTVISKLCSVESVYLINLFVACLDDITGATLRQVLNPTANFARSRKYPRSLRRFRRKLKKRKTRFREDPAIIQSYS